MKREVVVRFSEFAPDALEWDNPMLEESWNILPVFGGHRPVHTYDLISSHEDDKEPINGMHTHLTSGTVADDVLTIEDLSTTNLTDQLLDQDNTALSDLTVMDGAGANDATYMKYRQSSQPSAVRDFVIDPNDETLTIDTLGSATYNFKFRATADLTPWTVTTQFQEWDGAAWNDIAGSDQTLTEADGNEVWHIMTDTATMASFTNWTQGNANGNIRLHVVMTSTGTFGFNYNAPTSDVEISSGWETQTGTDFYAMVDDAYGSGWGVGADTTYIEGLPYDEAEPSAGAGSNDNVAFGVPVPYSEPNLESANDRKIEDLKIRAWHTGASGGTYKLNCSLYSTVGDPSPIATGDATITDTVANYDIVLNTSPTDTQMQNLAVDLWARNIDAPIEVDTDNYPASDISNTGGWVESDGGTTTNLYAVLDNVRVGLLEKYVSKTTSSAGVNFICNWDEAEPNFHSTANPTKIKIRAKKTGGAGKNVGLTISDDNGTSGWSRETGRLTNSYQIYTFVLSPTESEGLNWGDIDLKVETTSASNATYFVDWIDLVVPGNRPRIRISGLSLEAPDLQGFDVSWANIRLPVDATAAPVDDNQNWIFFGNKTKLSVIDDNTNLTEDLGVTFGQNLYPQAWDFASFGEEVYFTNYADRPYYWKPATPTTLSFSHTGGDVVGSIADFKYKYVAAVGDHLVVANVNHSSYESFTVCFSHFNNPQSFSAGDIGNQSDFQNLTDTPGPITGLLGGEYGLVFKRNSIYRMSYVGPDVIFRFDLISDNIGTPYNNSIVKVGDNVYFYSESGFYVMPGGGPPQKISDGKVTKFLTDAEFETYAVNSNKHPITLVNDIDVQGTYDQRSQLAWWLYRSKNAAYDGTNETWNSDYIIVYNPTENRWSIIKQEDLQAANQTGETITTTTDFTTIGSVMSPLGESNLLTRGVVFGYWDDATTDTIGVASLSSQYSTEARFRTKRLSADMFGVVDQSKRNRKITITGLRPVMYGTPESSFAPTVRFTVYSYENPWTDTAIATSTEVSTPTGDDGWYEINPINGEFFEIAVTIDKRDTSFTLKDLVGVGLKIDSEGEY
jgi:hypothetical protein